jgi:uncharacterized membrane protein YdjX (TVP38/TMEM64 family)
MKTNLRERNGQGEGWHPRRLWPLGLILVGIFLFFTLGLDEWLALEQLQRHRQQLVDIVNEHYLPSVLAFMLLYVLVVFLSLPGATVLTLAGSLLYGAIATTFYVVIAATLGATLLFLAAKTSFGDHLRRRAGPWMRRLEQGFQENAWSYLLILRLVPLFPFFVVNLVPAFLGVSLRSYFWTTLVGIIPGTFVYSLAGAGLGEVLAKGGSIGGQDILTPTILGAFIGLAVLSALPIGYKWVMKSRAGERISRP